MSKPFGQSYLLDMYGCKPGVCDDMELNYRFLETLVDKIGMTAFSPPIVIHGPRNKGVELYPDKTGVSGAIFLIESSIIIHTIEPKNFVTMDVYSCNCFDPNVVLQYALETYGYKQHEAILTMRGTKYGDD